MKLLKGKVYYLLLHFDEELEIPDISTFVFLGKNIASCSEEGKGDLWYFKDPQAYLEAGDDLGASPSQASPAIHRIDEDSLHCVFDIRGLIAELKKIE